MIDRKLEENIKRTEDFIQLWNKFRGIFKNAVSKSHVNKNKENEFLSVRNLVTGRYEDLMDSLGVKLMKRVMQAPFIYDLLTLDKISIMSDEKRAQVDKDWQESEKFLKGLLGRLKRKKERIEGFNKFVFLVKRRFAKSNDRRRRVQ